jgi:peptidyl-dipeptidase Dcp
MKTFYNYVVTIGVLVSACSVSEPNPFDAVWDTPFNTPPFDKIETKHYKPAILKGIELEEKDIEAIVNNPEDPTFENTIEALDYSGEYLARVLNVFNNMTGSMSDEEMRAIDQEMAPVLSAHRDDILLNEPLFERVKSVWNHREDLTLTSEQHKLLDETYKLFVRNGANLNETDKTKLRDINEELSVLAVQFGDNILKENNRFELIIDNEADLSGLPDAVISAASETAKERGYEDKWVFTIQKPSLIPFLQYSEKRDLRKKMFTAYIMKGNHGDELDNTKICSRMASLRVKKAKLLGYGTHAHFILEENMAKNPENVYELLNKLWKPALKRAKSEAQALQTTIDEEGGDFKLEPWDWWYYAEKVKKTKYDLDEEMLRPYFQLM